MAKKYWFKGIKRVGKLDHRSGMYPCPFCGVIPAYIVNGHVNCKCFGDATIPFEVWQEREREDELMAGMVEAEYIMQTNNFQDMRRARQILMFSIMGLDWSSPSDLVEPGQESASITTTTKMEDIPDD